MQFPEILNNLQVDKLLNLHIKVIEKLQDVSEISYKFGLYQNEKIIGELIIGNYGKIINIDTLWINKEFRQLNFGTKFLKHICEILKNNYLISLMASPLDKTIKLNDLINFYGKIGFKVVSTIIDNTVYMEYKN